MYKKNGMKNGYGMHSLPEPRSIVGWKFGYDKGEIDEIAEGIRKSPKMPGMGK